jgi:hypothetical protein
MGPAESVFDALITTDQSLRYQQTSLAADVRFFVLATTSWLRVRNRFAASNRWPVKCSPSFGQKSNGFKVDRPS